MDVSVPDLGDFADVEIVDILVKVGDRISVEDPLVSLETEKATMDVPSPAAGSVVEIKVAVGDRVSKGDVLLVLDGENEASAEAPESGRPSSAPAGDEKAPAGAPGADEPGEGAPRSGAAAESAAAATTAGGTSRAVDVPDLGDFSDVEIIDVLVGEGDEVEAEQGLITLETEKAAMDVPAPEAGTVVSLRVKAGDRVSTGDEILILRPRGASSAGKEAAKPSPAPAAAPPVSRPASAPRPTPAPPAEVAGQAPAPRRIQAPVAPVDEAAFSRAHASPSVRKLARELGVDLGNVRGTGNKGRVTADDLKAFVKEIMQGGAALRGPALPQLPEVDFAKFGEIERRPLARIQRISGARLHASWVNIPHVTQHDEADITALEEARQALKQAAEERGIRLTPLAFVLRACVLALGEFEHFKASLSPDGETLVMKRYTHLGFAADTPKGLVVPVIRDADQKDVYELASALGTLSQRAREGKLKPEDMQGGVFTVSSLGGIGGTFFTPIINAPEVAILGLSRSQWRPVFREGGFVPRLILPLSLSYDHRVIDGADAVRFTTRLAAILGDVERLLEAIP